MVSELRKVLGHCMKPGNDMGFCVDSQSSRERVARMTAVIDNNVQAIDVSEFDALMYLLGYESICSGKLL
jgi:hypothetical protein